VAGAVAFWIGAVTPPYRQWMGVPVEEYLTIVGNNLLAWRVLHAFFAIGALLTLAGFVGLTGSLWGMGDRLWPTLGATLFGTGAVLWLVQVGFRIAVAPWASGELSRSGQVSPVYIAGNRWMGVLFGMSMVAGYVAAVAYGVALVKTSTLRPWVGWTAIVFGAIALPGMATVVFQPPLMLFVVPFVIGIGILRN
jgi:hypothetical protein